MYIGAMEGYTYSPMIVSSKLEARFGLSMPKNPYNNFNFDQIIAG